MLLDKYRPRNFKEFVGNGVRIDELKKWLNNFGKNDYNNCLISGNHGIGKSTLIELLKEEFNLDIIEYNQSDLKGIKNITNLDLFFPKKSEFERLFYEKSMQKILIFNEIEAITIASEKNFIIKILKKNHKEKILPILLINNGKHSKLVNELKKYVKICNLYNPSLLEIKPLIKKICENENINLDMKYAKGIVMYCNSDIRKIILTLEELKSIYKKKPIGKLELKEYYNNNSAKQEEIGLYSSVNKLLNCDMPFDKIIDLYNLEKIILPLTFLENIPLKSPKIEDYSDVLDSYSRGDIVETSIYTDQNWYLQNLHAFDTCIYPNYKMKGDMITNEKELIFTNDLNKTSLKNINKKNIELIGNIIEDITFDEIINLSYVITETIKKKGVEDLKKLGISDRLIELIVKINKFEYDSNIMSKKKLNLG